MLAAPVIHLHRSSLTWGLRTLHVGAGSSHRIRYVYWMVVLRRGAMNRLWDTHGHVGELKVTRADLMLSLVACGVPGAIVRRNNLLHSRLLLSNRSIAVSFSSPNVLMRTLIHSDSFKFNKMKVPSS